MTDALNPTVPAGWYPDPWGAPEQRWWDGYAWTDNIHPAPNGTEPTPATAPEHSHRARSVAPQAEAAAATNADTPFPSRRTLREREAATGTIPIVDSEEFAMAEPSVVAASTAEPLPPFTHVPEFTPEPVSALPLPVWTEADQADVDATVAAATEEPTVAAVTPAVSVIEPKASATQGRTPVASAPIPVEVDDWAASLSKWDEVETATTTAPSEAPPIFGDAPPVSYSQRVMRYQPLHGRTSAVWFIVFMPLLHAAAVIGSLFLFPLALSFSGSVAAFVPTEGSLVALRDWILFASVPLAIAFFVFTLVMGFQDRARLRLLGHDQTASPWWLLLHPFVYLIVRSVRVRQSIGRNGSGPLTTYICLYIAPSVAIVIATAVISALDGAIPS